MSFSFYMLPKVQRICLGHIRFTFFYIYLLRRRIMFDLVFVVVVQRHVTTTSLSLLIINVIAFDSIWLGLDLAQLVYYKCHIQFFLKAYLNKKVRFLKKNLTS